MPARLSSDTVSHLERLIASGMNCYRAADIAGVHPTTAQLIKNGRHGSQRGAAVMYNPTPEEIRVECEKLRSHRIAHEDDAASWELPVWRDPPDVLR